LLYSSYVGAVVLRKGCTLLGFVKGIFASVLRRANVAKPLRVSVLIKPLRVSALLTSQRTCLATLARLRTEARGFVSSVCRLRKALHNKLRRAPLSNPRSHLVRSNREFKTLLLAMGYLLSEIE